LTEPTFEILLVADSVLPMQ